MDHSTIEIGGQLKSLNEADAAWIGSQVSGRGVAGVCIIFRVRTDEAEIMLATAACSLGRGGTSKLRPKEQEVINLWTRKMSGSYSTGDVVSFFQELKRVL